MPQCILGVLAGCLLLILTWSPAALAAGPANVTVRAEGKTRTLIPRTPVLTDTRTVNKDGQTGHDCTGTSAAGALEIASGGDWSGPWYDGLGYFASTIKGETPSGAEYFTFWLNNHESQTGMCQVELQEGDEVLFFVARCDFDPDTFQCTNPPVLPLGLTTPRRVTTGSPFTVKVVEYATDGTPTPVSGATVSGGGGQWTTGSDGTAAVTLASGGDTTLRAEKENRARSASEPVCATDGADGFCGTARPGEPAPPAGDTPAQECLTSGDDGRCGTADRRAPQGHITSVREGRRFARRRGPRELAGFVTPDPSGLKSVSLRLTRNDRGRCATFDGRTERLRRLERCGAKRGVWFEIGDRNDWSYLLPARLGRGRWVLDVVATDRAGNADRTLQRTRNRVVFRVG